MIESQIFQNLKRMYPFLYNQMESYVMLNNYDIHIKLKDGSTVLYDDFDKSFRQLPMNSREMTAEQCKIEFSSRLYRLMRRKCITQEALSEMTGITQPLISSYINGKTLPGFYNVDKIAKALGCSVDELRYC